MPSLPLEKAIPNAAEWRSSAWKSTAAQVLKFGLATGVVIYLIWRGDIGWEALWTSLRQWQYSLPAFIVLLLTPIGQLWRWQSLLRASGLILPHTEVLSYLMVSKFFNMAFPSYVSGDIIRGFYVSRRAQEPGLATGSAPNGRSVVAVSIFFDRVAGVVPLFIWSLLGLAISSFHQAAAMKLVLWVGLLGWVGIGGAAIFFWIAYANPQPPPFLVRISQAVRLEKPFGALYQSTHLYVRNVRMIRNILLISFLNHGLTIVGFILFGMALGIHVPLASYLVLVPWGLLLTAVPVAPSGLGIGQVAFLALFSLVGTSQGANLFTLYMASLVLINLSGAALYPFLRIRPGGISHRPVQAETAAGEE